MAKETENSMSTTRLEMFSDGVLAVIITVMVLELKTPHGAELEALQEVIPTFLAYILSFATIGIYWNNHHHLLHAAKTVTTRIMWSNLHLLFWISLIPFFTAWIGENYTHTWPTVFYGVILLITGFAYQLLQKAVAAPVGSDLKGKLSLVSYIAAIVLAFVNPIFSDLLYLIVAIVWFIPDKRLQNLG